MNGTPSLPSMQEISRPAAQQSSALLNTSNHIPSEVANQSVASTQELSSEYSSTALLQSPVHQSRPHLLDGDHQSTAQQILFTHDMNSRMLTGIQERSSIQEFSSEYSSTASLQSPVHRSTPRLLDGDHPSTAQQTLFTHGMNSPVLTGTQEQSSTQEFSSEYSSIASLHSPVHQSTPQLREGYQSTGTQTLSMYDMNSSMLTGTQKWSLKSPPLELSMPQYETTTSQWCSQQNILHQHMPQHLYPPCLFTNGSQAQISMVQHPGHLLELSQTQRELEFLPQESLQTLGSIQGSNYSSPDSLDGERRIQLSNRPPWPSTLVRAI
jgi:hypothetical protein